MKKKIPYKKIIAIAVGIVLNILGRYIADTLSLPVWLDTIGTFVAVYYSGLVGGIIASLTNNIFYAVFSSPVSIVYSITGLINVLLINYFIKKEYFNNVFKTCVSSFWLVIVCTVVTTPLNFIFSGGYTSNVWGDTLIDMLEWYDTPIVLASLAGQAIIEVVDKQVSMLIGFIIVNITNHIKNKKGAAKDINKNAAALVAFITALACVSGISRIDTLAVNIPEYNFVEEIYDNTNGMSSSEANVICETDDGYIWIGSYAGLTRYDGTQFEFIREGGLVNVVGMMTDSKGRLWIGTNDAGIARYENGKYTYFTVDNGLPSNSVRCFAEDNNGNVYVGTSGKICKFSSDDTIEILDNNLSFVRYMTVYNDKLVALDNTGDVHTIDENGVKQLDNNGFGDYFYFCIAPTSRGLMIGTETGELFCADVSSKGIALKEKIDITADQISAIFEDSKGRIWIAQRSETGYIGDDGKYRKVSFNGFDSSIVYFHEDYQGNLWLASTHYGVMKLSESPFIDVFEKAGIDARVVNAVEYYNGCYVCGTDSGLVVFTENGISGKLGKLAEAVEGLRVRYVFTDSKDNLWACTYGGLFRYSPDGEIRQYTMETDGVTSDRFRCMTELSDGTLAVGTADGINFFKDGELTGTLTSEDGLENTQILSIVEGYGNTVWAGSDGSGIYIISDGKIVGKYTVKSGLSSNIILKIVPCENGCIVVTSNALCYIDDKGERRLSNFPYFNNFDVIVDGEKAYITCSAGMYEAKLSELCADSDARYELYGASKGLLSSLTANSKNYLSEDGRLFLCSNSGVIVFSRLDSDNIDMKYGITSAECDGKPLEITNESKISIPANAENIELYASVRNYAFSDAKVRFFVKELDNNPKIYNWNEIEPIKIFKPDKQDYNICFQVLDSTGEYVLKETTYTLETQIRPWEKPFFRAYLVAVCAEALLLTIVCIVSMIIFVTRKNELERMQTVLEQKIAEQTGEIKALFVQTVTALSEAVDAKDRYTSGHSKRVAKYSRMIAARMGKDKDEQDEIYRAGLLHDVGKIRIPVEIINKDGKLTDEEYDIIKIHPVTGYHILRGISGSKLIAIAAKYHHERYDGKGYPNGLAGEKIPEAARILGVADSYDAMTSNRSYRNALPQDVVRAEIEKCKGTQFDPKIADIMIAMIDEDKDYTMRQKDKRQRRILTVDDEPINNKIIARIMKDEPIYEIVPAGGGREALSLLEEQTFDLILLDVNMPDMDGIETLKQIKEKYNVPVVLTTSDKEFDSLGLFRDLGCDDFVTKPFLPRLIKEIVHNMTERIDLKD